MRDNKELLYAAINCAHEIDSESVILFRDPSKDGNALHQLGVRLDAAAQPVVLSDEQKRQLVKCLHGGINMGWIEEEFALELGATILAFAAKEQA